tara:strand:- start:144 stop:269 length:126 start_codon:yes stop_codon:yes gene_type:complete
MMAKFMVLAFSAFHWNKTRSAQIVEKLSNLALHLLFIPVTF